ncbi:MAG: hypothetical protein PHW64_00360 [Sulfuricurvum sp.]|nr:hypothetical protein [Sulfuricurvum sp.]
MAIKEKEIYVELKQAGLGLAFVLNGEQISPFVSWSMLSDPMPERFLQLYERHQEHINRDCERIPVNTKFFFTSFLDFFVEDVVRLYAGKILGGVDIISGEKIYGIYDGNIKICGKTTRIIWELSNEELIPYINYDIQTLSLMLE